MRHGSSRAQLSVALAIFVGTRVWILFGFEPRASDVTVYFTNAVSSPCPAGANYCADGSLFCGTGGVCLLRSDEQPLRTYRSPGRALQW